MLSLNKNLFKLLLKFPCQKLAGINNVIRALL